MDRLEPPKTPKRRTQQAPHRASWTRSNAKWPRERHNRLRSEVAKLQSDRLLGFIEDRINGRAPSERVFSELSTSAADDKFGDALGKKFTEYRKNIGIYAELLDMHSFRHTVSTLLIRAGVPQAHAEEYVGHKSEARKTAFSIYDEGATIVILKEAIDKLVLPVDISLLLEAVKNSPTSVQGPPRKKASAPLCKANQEPPAKLVV